MPSRAEIMLPKMQGTRDELLVFVAALDQAALTWHPPEGGWSIRDNLAHLTDAERQETLAFIAAMPPAAWDRRGDHPALGDVSVEQVLKVIGVHERMHLKEMCKLLEAHGNEQRLPSTS